MATKFVAPFALSRRHTLGFYAPIAANLIATDSYGHTWRFFLPIATMWHFIPGSIGWRLKIARTNINNQNSDSEAKKLLAAAIFSECRRIKSPISDMPDIGDFIPRSRGLANIPIAALSTIGDFRRSPWSAYKIARCVTGFSASLRHRLLGGQIPGEKVCFFGGKPASALFAKE